MEASFKRIFDIVSISAKKYADKVAFAKKIKGEWKTVSYNEYLKQTNALSIWLIKNGLNKGDCVITISSNRYEWNVVDMAVPQAGGIHVPLFPTYSSADLKLIFSNCNPRFIFVEGLTMFTIVSRIVEQLAANTQVIALNENESNINFSMLVSSSFDAQDIAEFKRIRDAVTPEDDYTIAYTSGTGGNPNGALFKHKAFTESVKSLYPILGLSSEDTVLSYLPICHAYERNHNYCYQYLGVTIYYAENAASVIENLVEVKPAFFCTVPMLLERIYSATIARFNTFESFKIIAGANLKAISSAGAPLPYELGEKYNEIDILILECYGITELNLVSYNLYEKHKLGTVGIIGPNVKIKVTEEEELCIKSPYMFERYHKNPELTRIVFKDGWYHSGDLGEIDAEGFIKITGRKNDVFKSSSGNYISPTRIEERINASPYIVQSVVFKHQNKIAIMIQPDYNLFANDLGIDVSILSNPGNNKLLLEKLKKEIYSFYNSTVLEAEQISEYFIDPKTWSIEDGELTPTMKVKRKRIIEKLKLSV